MRHRLFLPSEKRSSYQARQKYEKKYISHAETRNGMQIRADNFLAPLSGGGLFRDTAVI